LIGINTGVDRREWGVRVYPIGTKWTCVPIQSMTVSTTVEIDDQGRLTVPKPVREALEIEGEEALIQLDIDVKRRKEAAE